jgi:hypothetical protein
MPRYWVIAPYDSRRAETFDKAWQYDLKNGTIAVGWQELGDISLLDNEQLRQKYIDVYGEYSPIDCNTLWKFYHEISDGDIVIARRGRKIMLGVGKVIQTAFYDPDRGKERIGHVEDRAYPNFLKVEWEDKVIDYGKQVFAMSTLYEIPENKYVQLIKKDIGSDDEATAAIKLTEIEAVIEEFREYLETDEAKSHLDYLCNKEPRQTKEIFDKLKTLKRGSDEFVELVLFGLLPYSKSKYAKRISIAPAFMNIKKFFARFKYNEEDWKNIAELIFCLFVEFEKDANNLSKSIKKFILSDYSKALQCGSLSPVFYSLNNKFPIINNRERRTYKTLSISILGKRDKLSQKLEDYIANINKIRKFIQVCVKKYGFSEIEDMAVFDLFCYWFDEHFMKEEVVKKEKLKERKIKKTKAEYEEIGADVFEETEEEQVLDIAPDIKKVIWQPKDYSIRELFEMYKDGDLILQPKFQRFFVWDDKKSSRLIESIFLDVPIPVIYLAEEGNGQLTVIDGQQRLTSFFKFMDGKLKLKGLLVFSDLNGKTYQELKSEQKSKFKKATLHIIVIKKESQEDIRFEIFERLNTGSVKLNDQELRNCIFRGKYNVFLEELSYDKDYLSLLGLKEPHKRMVDRELILRFFAFYHKTYLRYEPPMKSFLNREMEANQNLDQKDIEKLKNLFRKSIELSKYVFGENAFKRFTLGSSIDPNGVWEKRRVNKALFDIIMYGFTDYDKHQIIPKSDAVREELIWLMTHDQEFIDSVMIGTSDKSRILTRFEKWLRSLREIVGYPEAEPRSFSSQLKKDLFNSNNTCAICNQEIKLIDDAEVDHIDFYWRGGRTIPSNARLVHRFCNRYRGARE